MMSDPSPAAAGRSPGLATIGTIVVVDNGRSSSRPIVAIRTGASSFLALSLVCPHRGCTIGVLSRSFQCPCHGAQFNGSGVWTGGQSTSNMYRYSTTYDSAAGTLTIGAEPPGFRARRPAGRGGSYATDPRPAIPDRQA